MRRASPTSSSRPLTATIASSRRPGRPKSAIFSRSLGRPVLAAPPGATGLGFDHGSRLLEGDAGNAPRGRGRVAAPEGDEARRRRRDRRGLGDRGFPSAPRGRRRLAGAARRSRPNCSAEISSGPECARLTAMAEELADRSRSSRALTATAGCTNGRSATRGIFCRACVAASWRRTDCRRAEAARLAWMQSSPQPLSPPRKTWLGAFAHPAFAVVWAASTIALIGIAMYDTASGWLMTTLDLNPFDVSLVHAATNLPMFLFTLPAGAIADIVDPRRLILAVSCAIAALVAIFAGLVSFDLATPVLLLLTTFLLSAAWALNLPAWLSILPSLVPKSDLPEAIAANGVAYNLSRTVGPALGGFAIVNFGVSTPFWAFVAANLAVIAALLWLRAPQTETASLPAERLEQRGPGRPSACGQQPAVAGDACARIGRLSLRRRLLGPAAADRAADRDRGRALWRAAQRDQRGRDLRLVRTAIPARQDHPRLDGRPRNDRHRCGARPVRLDARIRRRARRLLLRRSAPGSSF